MYNVYRVNVDKVIENRKNVDNMFDLIHTYIHVLLKNNIFVDNFYRTRKYIDTGPLCKVDYYIRRGVRV